ncbi:MAG: GTP-binding protein [Lawsonibacter sp.]|nr:GTP-binding protein [Lawsonibacter sp.]
MKKLAIGILAHVDAGKTTLSEAMLYLSGSISRLGRVDHRDAFLDTDALERERGITIFSKQAVLPLKEAELTLLDTPGHVDFSAEMERTLQVLDCAVLVVSGADGVQGHTHTLWQLLRRHRIPTFLFLNKMDLETRGEQALMEELRARLDENCVSFSRPRDSVFWESVAMCGEEALSSYLETGTVPEEEIAALIAGRKLFPCWFGSALKLEGVEEFLEGLERWAPRPPYPPDFGARVFKIARDPQGTRLTYLKITGGALSVKETLRGPEGAWTEKVDQIRIYSGSKYQAVPRAEAGTVCAVTGLSATRPGDGLGTEPPSVRPLLEPVLTYRLLLPPGCDPHTALPRLAQLEEEDPQLHLVWKEELGEIHLQLMGEIQLEVLRRLIGERFGLEVSFSQGSIVYKETVAAPAEGVGHFEPLRHYAEVRLLLEPGAPGSGLRFASACSPDVLDKNWQRLVLTHLEERQHPGVLTGSPITDMKITLIAGRAHQKHTEGGDFRQATYRAVRQGLMGAENVLLEPWYSFRLELPGENVGRAMSDLQAMGGEFDPPQAQGELTLLAGHAPVAGLRDYQREVSAYSRGRGRLSCRAAGYFPCREQERVVQALGYDPERDVLNPAGSVFCSHGAGYVVPWEQVPRYAHVPSPLAGPEREEAPEPGPERIRPAAPSGSLEQDRELQAIFERTYGKVEPRAFQPAKKPARTSLDGEKYSIRTQNTGPEYLLVDGYNIIFAWDELKQAARENVEAARAMLTDILCDYRGLRRCEVILVFDAYKVKGNPGSVDKQGDIYVVYTKEAETADAYIEKATYDLGRNHRVRVATSDGLEQLIILGHGALRVSARAFRQEIEQAQGQLAELIARHNRKGRELDQLKYTAKITRSKD